jgi:SpoVK/Ycf46/Vps4 family AAA+-type ATPase
VLFGPAGTGKTMIARAIASSARCTFFAVSPSALMSKWVDESEKLVCCLFAVARVKRPSVIFIDEIDWLLRKSESEILSRRVKGEFMLQLAGLADSERVLVVGATSRPDLLDENALRRLEKRLYIPLPDHDGRVQMIQMCLNSIVAEEGGSTSSASELTGDQLEQIARRCESYSGDDITTLCREACMMPVSEIMESLKRANNGVLPPDLDGRTLRRTLRPVSFADFESALRRIKSSVLNKEVERHLKFNAAHGRFPRVSQNFCHEQIFRENFQLLDK